MKVFVYICSYHGMQEASQTLPQLENPGHYLSFAIKHSNAFLNSWRIFAFLPIGIVNSKR